MSPRRGSIRAFVLVWAAVQLALPGVAALADAFASRASVHATAHIEGSTSRNCVRVHETDCVFCQFLTSGASPTRVPLVYVATTARQDAPGAARDLAPTRGGEGIANPRAPPAA